MSKLWNVIRIPERSIVAPELSKYEQHLLVLFIDLLLTVRWFLQDLAHCQHRLEMDCGQKASEVSCPFECEMLLDCGHICNRPCHKRSSHEKLACRQPCLRSPCSLNHPCPKRCHEDCGDCQTKLLKKLPCGHEVY